MIGKKKKCDLCNGVARMYCESDQASLCWDCDGKVHGANFLVAKHTRCLLCTSCQSLTPWKAAGLRLGPTFSVCDSCLSLKSAAAAGGVGDSAESYDNHRLRLGDDEDGGDSAESYDDDEEEEYSDEDEDVDEEEEEAENQVVPWSAEAAAKLPPMMSSSSSSDGGDLAGKRRRRDCSDDEIGSSSAQGSNYSPPSKRASLKSTAEVNSLIRLEGEGTTLNGAVDSSPSPIVAISRTRRDL